MTSTPQEKFWQGGFGFEYTDRNDGSIGPQINLFAKILARTDQLESVFEIGCNRGLNLDAIRLLSPKTRTCGLEINEHAKQIAVKAGHDVHLGSALSHSADDQYDMSISSGVLIHLDPDSLNPAYDLLYATSLRYILINEYFNPTPVMVPYRGNSEKLFKRDFAAELMQRHSLELIDYGFTWRHDPQFPLDDSHWFLFKK